MQADWWLQPLFTHKLLDIFLKESGRTIRTVCGLSLNFWLLMTRA
jgi:hypothetical protein